MTSQARQQSEGLTFAAYPGDGAVLLAFDLDQGMQQDLAGFAVEYTDPDGQTFPVLNRLGFAQQLTSATTPEQRHFFPTSQAPLQKFHWVHFPPDVKPGTFTYKATAMLFQPGSETALTAGPSVEVGVTLMPPRPGPFQLGFTRGYISSQAYAEQFHNDPIAPTKPTFDFDTSPFQAQYQWLGFHARRLIFDFIAETLADKDLSLDVFAYDLDEPDFIRQLGQLGPACASTWITPPAISVATDPEPKAHAWLAAQGAQVKVGHFQRFSHDKVLIQKRNNTAVKVLSGSANFSVRGLYVQSNNVFTFDDPATAALYEQAFQQSWDDPAGFDTSALAASWHDCGGHDGLPGYSLCFSPHHDASVSLDRVTAAVTNATSSVLFAIMEIGAGTGPSARRHPGSAVTARALCLRHDPAAGWLPEGPEVRRPGQLAVHSLLLSCPARCRRRSGPSGAAAWARSSTTSSSSPTSTATARRCSPAPPTWPPAAKRTTATTSSASPTPASPQEYAIEAIQLVDHYRFRAAMQKATDAQPLQLKPRSADWAADYYNPASPRCRERTVLA